MKKTLMTLLDRWLRVPKAIDIVAYYGYLACVVLFICSLAIAPLNHRVALPFAWVSSAGFLLILVASMVRMRGALHNKQLALAPGLRSAHVSFCCFHIAIPLVYTSIINHSAFYHHDLFSTQSLAVGMKWFVGLSGFFTLLAGLFSWKRLFSVGSTFVILATQMLPRFFNQFFKSDYWLLITNGPALPALTVVTLLYWTYLLGECRHHRIPQPSTAVLGRWFGRWSGQWLPAFTSYYATTATVPGTFSASLRLLNFYPQVIKHFLLVTVASIAYFWVISLNSKNDSTAVRAIAAWLLFSPLVVGSLLGNTLTQQVRPLWLRVSGDRTQIFHRLRASLYNAIALNLVLYGLCYFLLTALLATRYPASFAVSHNWQSQLIKLLFCGSALLFSAYGNMLLKVAKTKATELLVAGTLITFFWMLVIVALVYADGPNIFTLHGVGKFDFWVLLLTLAMLIMFFLLKPQVQRHYQQLEWRPHAPHLLQPNN
jgi:hypothetical protein